MKNYFIIGLVCLMAVSCKNDIVPNNSESKLDSTDNTTTTDVIAADVIKSDHCKSASDFLAHYAKNYEKIYEQDFINYGDVYSLNLRAVDNYIENARLPQYFTDGYITNLVSFCMKIDKDLKANPQSDGTVDGLESDLILHTQEPEELLADINGGKIKCTQIAVDKVLIDFQNGHSLIFKFHDYEIDDIELK